MSLPIIQFENLGKSYLVGHQSASQESYTALRDVFGRTVKNFGRKAWDMAHGRQIVQGGEIEEFWALKDVSFDVNEGEVVGIIGRNGAGKSTLLKVLSRITEPTKGTVTLRGRVASLLEVGTGFHPELTGRENIFLNGAILGMARAEIKSKFDEIVDFAGVERFLDTPVKRYSSGMYVRLAFAVAAHLEPEVLVVDEVLAVGDAEFQKKCLSKMKDVAEGGRTVLFVSHNMEAVSTLTKRCLLLDHGSMSLDGPSEDVVPIYFSGTSTPEATFTGTMGNDTASVISVELRTSHPNNLQRNGEPFEARFRVSATRALKNAAFSFQIVDSRLRAVVHMWVVNTDLGFTHSSGDFELRCAIPQLRLYKGRYTITTHLSEGENGDHLESREGLCAFEVAMLENNRGWAWADDACKYIEDGSWTIKPITV